MRNLHRKTKELVVLGVQRGIYLEYIESLRAIEDGIQLYISPGTRRLLVQIGPGWLILSRFAREEAVEIYNQTIASRELTAAEFSRTAFLKRLRENAPLDISFTRARDFIRPAAHWGGAMIAALIPVPPNHRPLAIGVGGPADRLERKQQKIIADLRGEIAQIAKAVRKW